MARPGKSPKRKELNTSVSRPRVVFQPFAQLGMQRGINRLLSAIRPTLGPSPRSVAVERTADRTRRPELLDSGGLIARRTIQLANRDEDMGAMLARGALCRLHDEVGDGTATAAVLFQAIYNGGIRHLVAGGNAMRLRRYFEDGLRVILAQLDGLTLHRDEDQDGLAKIANSVCYDAALAKALGEIFETIGEYGQLELRSGRGRDLAHEYVEGSYWDGGLLSRAMLSAADAQKIRLENPAILVTDLDIEDPHDVVPVLELAIAAGRGSIILTAGKISEQVIGLLQANSKDPARFRAIAVKTPDGHVKDLSGMVEDLAVLTGGRPVFKRAGDSLKSVRLEDMGGARRAWADMEYWGIAGGSGDPARLRQQAAGLRGAFAGAEDPDLQKNFQKRLGKLFGGSANLWVGALTVSEIEVRKEVAQHTADVLRAAMRDGVLPGGGAAFLACRPAMRQRLLTSRDEDARAAYRILLRALEEPFRVIVANAGMQPGRSLSQVEAAGGDRHTLGSPVWGLEVLSGQVVDVVAAGLLDVATVQKAAVRSAVSAAALALTIDILVQRKQPELSLKPQ